MSSIGGGGSDNFDVCAEGHGEKYENHSLRIIFQGSLGFTGFREILR